MSGGAHGGGPPRDPPLRSLLWRAGGRFLFRSTFRTWYGPRRLILTLFGTRLTPRTKFRRTARVDLVSLNVRKKLGGGPDGGR